MVMRMGLMTTVHTVTKVTIHAQPHGLLGWIEHHSGFAAWLSAGGALLAVGATAWQTLLAEQRARSANRRQRYAEQTLATERAATADSALQALEGQLGTFWRALDSLVEALAAQVDLPNHGSFDDVLVDSAGSHSIKIYAEEVLKTDARGLPGPMAAPLADAKAAVQQIMAELQAEAANPLASLSARTVIAVMRERLRRIDLALGVARVERARIDLDMRLRQQVNKE